MSSMTQAAQLLQYPNVAAPASARAFAWWLYDVLFRLSAEPGHRVASRDDFHRRQVAAASSDIRAQAILFGGLS